MQYFYCIKYWCSGLAAFGVVGYINLILLFVFLGMGQGTQPLVSRFYGQKDQKSIYVVYRLSLIIGILAYLGLLLLKGPLTTIFIDPRNIVITDLTMSGIKLFFFLIKNAFF